MSNWLAFPLAVLLGLGMGVFYFWGLWLTVRRLPTTRYPVPLTLVSLLLRVSLCLLGFSLILSLAQPPNPLPLLACVATFFWTRNRIVQRLGIKPG